MKEIFFSLLAGWVIGMVFSWLRLPLPIPPLSGLFGLVGMFLGEIFWQWIRKLLEGVIK